MTDHLVRLYDLPDIGWAARMQDAGITIRRPLAPERERLLAWIGERFGSYWVGEAAVGLGQMPPTVLIGHRGEEILGFACYDTTAKGFFGPIGVAEAARGQGVGEALLFATLSAMRAAGYGYGIIGAPGPVGFYRRHLETVEIPGSEPGVYAGMLAPLAPG